MPSTEYLSKLVEQAKSFLPAHLFKQLVFYARAHAGGKAKARNRKNEEREIIEAALSQIEKSTAILKCHFGDGVIKKVSRFIKQKASDVHCDILSKMFSDDTVKSDICPFKLMSALVSIVYSNNDNILELFAGKGVLSKVYNDYGFDTTKVDKEGFNKSHKMSALKFIKDNDISKFGIIDFDDYGMPTEEVRSMLELHTSTSRIIRFTFGFDTRLGPLSSEGIFGLKSKTPLISGGAHWTHAVDYVMKGINTLIKSAGKKSTILYLGRKISYPRKGQAVYGTALVS